MIKNINKSELNTKNLSFKSFSQQDFWQKTSYSPLLNQQELMKGLKRNIWKYELRPMLKGFISNINEFKQDLRFKVSGKILNTSTYVLKTKSNRVINNSLETQEDIKDAQLIELSDEEALIQDSFDQEENQLEYYDDEEDLFEVFAELAAENSLSEEQLASFKGEKIKRILNLEPSELNKKIKNKINLLKIYRKPIYKKIELKDVADAINDVFKAKEIELKSKTSKPRKIDKSKLPFLPENLIANAEKKRMNFEKRIEDFYMNLKSMYSDGPISFLTLIQEPNAKALVNTLLIVLHLINQKRIELWKKCAETEGSSDGNLSENNGQNIFISPL